MTPDKDFQIALIFAIGTGGMLILAGGIVLFVFFFQKKMLQEEIKRQNLEVEHQTNMLGAALESQENERIRVSKDLHDDVGMMLMTMRTYLHSINEKTFLDDDVVPNIRALVDDTHETIRRISWDLMPSTLSRYGLVQTIREMCERLSVRKSLPVVFQEINVGLTLDKNQETLLYRVIQESVTNALKHSQASKIVVTFNWGNPYLNVSIVDDGIGFDFPTGTDKIKMRQGLGLLNIESRVNILGGKLTYERNTPSGVIVNIKLKAGQ